MEINASKKISQNIKNKTVEKLLVILEPGCYYEEIPPGGNLKITVENNADDDLANFFDFEYQHKQLTIFMNNDISKPKSYKINLVINQKVVESYEL